MQNIPILLHDRWRLKAVAKNTSGQATLNQKSSLTQQRTQLRTKIQTWQLLLPLYIPGLLQYQIDLEKKHGRIPEPEHPEEQKIWLPSHLPAELRNDMCYPGLPEMEEKLRTAQCYSALDALRHCLRIKSRLYFQKQKNIRGQRDGTHSRAVIDRIHLKAVRAGQKYRWARAAKLKLSGKGDWENVLKPLEDSDIRSYREAEQVRPKKGRMGTREDNEKVEWEVTPDVENLRHLGLEAERDKRSGTGETRRTFSWIWLMPRKPNAADATDETMRVEWVKSRARATRAKEEVLLLKEEMRRVVAFLGWKSHWWLNRVGMRSGLDKSLAEGLRAIAVKQSQLQMSLRDSFQALWKVPLKDISPDQLIVPDDMEDGVPKTDEDDDSEEEGEEVLVDGSDGEDE
ncbi:hypothetical protein CVT24_013117 [Panaeolus cyanescens]|uniref:Uncharacterized protein n=1 Tax=Panaeolus cyanescens TaxID=181874 RepID=A0A409YN68_9AGAR|nr:hypothetical protein CVT24_013117 [Panaeolus cyanescens]